MMSSTKRNFSFFFLVSIFSGQIKKNFFIPISIVDYEWCAIWCEEICIQESSWFIHSVGDIDFPGSDRGINGGSELMSIFFL